jgi:hypothetical protein
MSSTSDITRAETAADWHLVARRACAIATLAYGAGDAALGDYYLTSAGDALTIASEVWVEWEQPCA